MMEITQYKAVNKGPLIATINLKLPKWGGFIIRDIMYFKKADSRWISFPSRQYEAEGVKKYYSYCMFEDREQMNIFQIKVIEAIDQYILANPEQKEALPAESGECPF